MTDKLDEVRTAVLALPQVTDVAVAPWRDPSPRPGRHLADLLPPATAPTGAAPAPAPETAVAGPATSEAGPSFLDGGPLVLPDDYPRTLQEALARAARDSPDKGITYLLPDGETNYVAYPQLLADAERGLAGLRARGLRPGDSVIFQFDQNHAFITAYWACVLGGFLPTPLAVAPDYETGAGKLHNTWTLLDRPLVLTDLDAAELAGTLARQWGEDVRVVALADVLAGDRDEAWFPARPDSPVLNLLTSGSTGVPKCVRHANRSIVRRTWADTVENGLTADEVTLNSAAMDHVLGSVMLHIRDVFLRCSQVNVKTELFIARPLNWLDWTDRYRITNLGASNFAFALVTGYADEIAAGTWDLRTLRLVFNGGEPVVSRTAHTFLTLLAPHGLPADAMVPAWGMSETGSGVTYARMTRTDLRQGVVVIDQASMGGDLRAATVESRQTVTFTAVGGPMPGCVLRIVDADGELVPRGRVGRLEVTGDTMMTGYFNNEAANAEAYTSDGWFRTGDLAFVWDDGIVIAGRERDLIIVNGANYLCHEIEAVVSGVPGVVPTGTAAGGLFSTDIGTDRLLVFFVPEEGTDAAGTVRGIRAAVTARIGIAPDAIVPVTAAEFPRTESGKIQRGRLIAAYAAGEYAARLRELEIAEEGPDTLPAWFFTPAWEASPLPSGADGALLVFADEPVPGAVTVRPTDGESRFDGDYWLNPDDEDGYARILAEAGPLDGIVHAWSTAGDAEDLRGGLRRGLHSVVRLARAMGERDTGLVVLTRFDGALANGALVGLVQTIATERPAGITRLIDLAGDAYPPDLAAEAGTPGDVLVRYQDGQRFAARLGPAADVRNVGDPFPTGGCYLVTGGLGGIGREVARFLVTARGARVLLAGRSPATDLPVDVRYERVDVADADALRAAVERAERDWGQPLTGVLHLAGASLRGQMDDLEAHLVAREPTCAFERMFAAKVHGTVAAARLLDDRPGAFLLLFSSVNGYFGGTGFGAYAAASSFQDVFAEQWSARHGRDVQSLAWSHWTDVGMNVGGPATTAATARGFRPITPAQGIGSLVVARASGDRRLLVGIDARNADVTPLLVADATRPAALVGYVGGAARFDAVRQAAADVLGADVPVLVAPLAELPRTPDGAIDVAALARSARRDGAARTEPPALGLEADLAQVLCDVLGRGFIGRDESFFEVGGNSMSTILVQDLVARRLERKLPLRTLYQHPTVRGLATALAG